VTAPGGNPKVTPPNPAVEFCWSTGKVISMKKQVGKTESTCQDHLPGETNIAQRYAPIARQDTLKEARGNLNRGSTKITETRAGI
jgi:hypothetical protein